MRLFAVPALALLLAACTAGTRSEIAAIPSNEVGGTLFVANKRGNSLSRIDLASGEETHRANTCENPHELAVSLDGNHVALACYSGTSLEIFATGDLARVKRIELGEGARPHGVVWHDSGMLVATAEGRGSIFVVEQALSDSPQVSEIGSSAQGPHMVVVDEAGETAWGTVAPTAEVIRYHLPSRSETGGTRLEGETEAIALSPGGGTLWVGANAANRVYRVDPSSMAPQGETATGAVPIRIAIHPSGRWAVTSNLGDGSLSVIDTESGEVARTITVSGGSEAGQVTLVFSKDGERLYAAETFADTIAEVDFATGEVLRRLQAGEGGDGLAVD